MIAARFTSRSDLTALLAEQLMKGRLALILGAGISMDLTEKDDGTWMGLPSWPTLIKNLYDTQQATPKSSNLVNAAEDFRLTYCYENQPLWLKSVKDALYKDVNLDFSAIRKNDTLGAIGALAMLLLREGTKEIITFNLDDVLERYLYYHGLMATPIHDEVFWASRADIVIYHPHGFLNSPGSPFSKSSTSITLDRRAYSEKSGHPDLRMSQKIETIMQSHMCLFIGISGDDERLDTLICLSKEKHAYDPSELGYWGVAISNTATSLKHWADRGIFLQVVDDYFKDLPKFLFEICQAAALKHSS